MAGLWQALGSLQVETAGPGFTEISKHLDGWLGSEGAADGLLTVFIRHTSASLTIQENADPDVQTDLLRTLARLAPEDHGYAHHCEGPDDMPAHIKSMLTATSLGIPVTGGNMVLGMWQGVYVVEHRARPHRRELFLHFLGTTAS